MEGIFWKSVQGTSKRLKGLRVSRPETADDLALSNNHAFVRLMDDRWYVRGLLKGLEENERVWQDTDKSTNWPYKDKQISRQIAKK